MGSIRGGRVSGLSNSLLVGSTLVTSAHKLSVQDLCFTLVCFVTMFTSGLRMRSRSSRISSFGGTLYRTPDREWSGRSSWDQLDCGASALA